MCGYMDVYPFVCGERHISVSLYPLKSRIKFSFFLKKKGDRLVQVLIMMYHICKTILALACGTVCCLSFS